MSCTDTAKVTGQRQLFLGVETQSWTSDQFGQAADFARNHGVDSLLVKVADGGNEWYGGLAGYRSIASLIHAHGVGCIPYTYSYCNQFGALDREIDILIAYMQLCGVVCCDMEAEWNGEAEAAAHLCQRMQPVAGVFLVSTWADPYQQNWGGVLRALNPCVNAYMPQQYDNFLSSCWEQFGQLGAACLMPTVNMTGEFGANDPVQIASAAHAQGHAAISVWHYGTAAANPGLLDQVLAAFPQTIETGGQETMSGVPQGWHDDGNLLRDPSNRPPEGLSGAVRTNILSGWDPADTFLESERVNSILFEDGRWGPGTLVFFKNSTIAVADKPDPQLTGGQQQENVTFRVPGGSELSFAHGIIAGLDAKIATLQAQLAAAEPASVKAAVDEAIKAIEPLA